MKWVIRILAGLAGLLLVAVVAIFAMGHRPSAGHIHASAEIRATPEQLWPWINDGAHLKQWVSWLVEVRGSDADNSSVGTKRVLVMRDENNGGMLMEIDSRFSEYAPPRKLTVALSAAGEFSGDQTYELHDLGDGRTRLDISSTFRFTNAFANFMEPLITPAAQKKMDGDLARLKTTVESAH